MKISTISGAYVEVHPLKLFWMKTKLLFSRKAKGDMDAAVASLTHVEHLQEIDRIREKAKAHVTLIEEVKAGQPEIVVMESSLKEYEEQIPEGVVRDIQYEQTDLGNADDTPVDHTGTLDMKSVDWNPDADEIAELYNNLDERIVVETEEIGDMLKRQNLKKKLASS